MIRNAIYWLFGTGALWAMLVSAGSGAYFTIPVPRGSVTRDVQGHATIRGSGSTFVWLGGGYHGGK